MSIFYENQKCSSSTSGHLFLGLQRLCTKNLKKLLDTTKEYLLSHTGAQLQHSPAGLEPMDTESMSLGRESGLVPVI